MNNEDICCPKFNPEPWDDKIFEWNNKKFIKDKVFTLFYMPINFGAVVRRVMVKIDKAGANVLDWMSLSDHTSRWNMDLYVAVDREIPGAENVTLSGKFLSKAYEGDFKETGKWCEDFKKFAKNKGWKSKNGICGIPLAPNAPKNTTRIMW